MLPSHYATPAAIILVVAGLAACFAGYRMFRIVLGVYGFIVGALVTTSLMGQTNTLALVLAAIVGGLVGAILMVAAYFLGVALIGAGLAALAINAGWHLVAKTEPSTVVLVIGCVLGAVGALAIVRYVIVFGTALAGSWTTIVGALALMGDTAAAHALAGDRDLWILYPLDPSPGRWWLPLAWFGLAIVGALVQMATSKRTVSVKRSRQT